ncbi:MAG TPA: hypothetical protein VFZ61_24270 [Polyangiales bacterium]
MNAHSRRWALLASALLSAAACEPGETHILGRVPDLDADSEQQERDAGRGDAAREECEARGLDDAAPPACEERDDCTCQRPYCSDYLGHCVQCFRDRHCGDPDEWFCRDEDGTCVRKNR